MKTVKPIPNDAKEVFKKCLTCSRTFFYLLDREFGHSKEDEERAADPLAGGILRKGHQCGMLWGAVMATGAEAYRRSYDRDQAIGLAMKASQHLVDSFIDRTHTVDCKEITGTDFSKPLQMLRFMLFRSKNCYELAEDWMPEAIEAARAGLDSKDHILPERCRSCAAEVVRRMGASEEEMTIVAGLAGGIGLSGNACGALSAAIWLNSLRWSEANPGKSAYNNPAAKHTLNAFLQETNGEFLCSKLTGLTFENIEEHSEFIKNKGCEALINTLAKTSEKAYN